MKKVLLLMILAFTFLWGYSQTNEQDTTPRDTIFQLGGKVLPVNVTKITASYVSFVYPGEPEVYTIERKQVQRIVYKNGRVEEFNKPVLQMIDEYQWEAVWLTDDKKDVTEMYKRGEVSAASAPSSRSPKAAKKSATIRLQKKAANMKGTVILVTHKETTGGYGEYPGYFIEGVVYGPEPLEEAQQTSDKDKNPADGKSVY